MGGRRSKRKCRQENEVRGDLYVILGTSGVFFFLFCLFALSETLTLTCDVATMKLAFLTSSISKGYFHCSDISTLSYTL